VSIFLHGMAVGAMKSVLIILILFENLPLRACYTSENK
jgi:hypothetical protein